MNGAIIFKKREKKTNGLILQISSLSKSKAGAGFGEVGREVA